MEDYSPLQLTDCCLWVSLDGSRLLTELSRAVTWRYCSAALVSVGIHPRLDIDLQGS